jgi:hypothetical protein
MALPNVNIVMSQKHVLFLCFMLVYQYPFGLRHSLLPYFLSTSPIFSGKTPYDLLFGKKLNYSMLRVAMSRSHKLITLASNTTHKIV